MLQRLCLHSSVLQHPTSMEHPVHITVQLGQGTQVSLKGHIAAANKTIVQKLSRGSAEHGRSMIWQADPKPTM